MNDGNFIAFFHEFPSVYVPLVRSFLRFPRTDLTESSLFMSLESTRVKMSRSDAVFVLYSSISDSGEFTDLLRTIVFHSTWWFFTDRLATEVDYIQQCTRGKRFLIPIKNTFFYGCSLQLVVLTLIRQSLVSFYFCFLECRQLKTTDNCGV